MLTVQGLLDETKRYRATTATGTTIEEETAKTAISSTLPLIALGGLLLVGLYAASAPSTPRPR